MHFAITSPIAILAALATIIGTGASSPVIAIHDNEMFGPSTILVGLNRGNHCDIATPDYAVNLVDGVCSNYPRGINSLEIFPPPSQLNAEGFISVYKKSNCSLPGEDENDQFGLSTLYHGCAPVMGLDTTPFVGKSVMYHVQP